MTARSLSRGVATRASAPCSAATTFAEIRAIYWGGAIFWAETFALDGVSGKTSAVIDVLDPTHAAGQAVSAQQPAAPLPDALFSGRRSLVTTGSEYLDSNRTNEYWKFCHAGTGVTAVHAHAASVTASSVSFATRAGGSAGISLSRTATPTYNFTVQSATTPIITSPAGTPVLNRPVAQSVTYSEGASPEWAHKIGNTLINSGNSTNVPTTTASTSVPLRLFATGNASAFDRSRWVMTLIKPGAWTPRDQGTTLRLLAQLYGIKS